MPYYRPIVDQTNQRTKSNPALDFADVLNELQQSAGSIEASFASKLPATVDPQRPVIDSIVLKVLGERLPYHYKTNWEKRKEEIIGLYGRLIDRLAKLQQDTRFEALKANFRLAFPDDEFTDLKILDLLIWE